jgi:K+-sensing histidine kinase KdpD
MTVAGVMKDPSYSRLLLGYICALALTALMTIAIGLIRVLVDVGNISMVYLLAVLAAAVGFGRGPAIAAAIASFLAYNFFFIEPRGEFSVANEDEWIALILLLLTALITGELAASLRKRAREAERREREAVVLYDVVRLMGDSDLERALTAVAERLRTELALSAVLIVFGKESPMRAQADTGDSEAIALAREAAGPVSMVLGAGQAPTASERGQPGPGSASCLRRRRRTRNRAPIACEACRLTSRASRSVRSFSCQAQGPANSRLPTTASFRRSRTSSGTSGGAKRHSCLSFHGRY